MVVNWTVLWFLDHLAHNYFFLFWDTRGPIGWQWRIFCSLGGFVRNLKMIFCFLGGGTQESKSFVLGLLESGLFKTKHKEVSNSAGCFVWNILERRGSRWVLVPSESFTRNYMEPENGTHEDEIPSKTAFLSNGDGCSTVIATWRVGEFFFRKKNARNTRSRIPRVAMSGLGKGGGC